MLIRYLPLTQKKNIDFSLHEVQSDSDKLLETWPEVYSNAFNKAIESLLEETENEAINIY